MAKFAAMSFFKNRRLCESIAQLPLELLTEIMAHLPPEDSCSVSLLSRFFKLVAEHNYLWKRKRLRDKIVERNNRSTPAWKDTYIDCINNWKQSEVVEPWILEVRLMYDYFHRVFILMSSEFFVSDADSRTLEVWSLETGSFMGYLKGHDDKITCSAIANSTMITGSADGEIKIWDLKKVKCIQAFEGHMFPVTEILISDNRAISIGKDNCLRFWDLEKLECTCSCFYEDMRPLRIDFNGEFVVTSNDYFLDIYDSHVGFVARIDVIDEANPANPISIIRLVGKYVICSYSVGSSLTIVDLHLKKIVHRIDRVGNIYEIEAHGNTAVIATRSGMVLYNISSGRFIRKLRHSLIKFVKIQVKFDLIIGLTSLDTIQLWHAGTGNFIRTLNQPIFELGYRFNTFKVEGTKLVLARTRYDGVEEIMAYNFKRLFY